MAIWTQDLYIACSIDSGEAGSTGMEFLSSKTLRPLFWRLWKMRLAIVSFTSFPRWVINTSNSFAGAERAIELLSVSIAIVRGPNNWDEKTWKDSILPMKLAIELLFVAMEMAREPNNWERKEWKDSILPNADGIEIERRDIRV